MDALRHRMHTAFLAKQQSANPACLAKFKAARNLLARVRSYVDMALIDPMATAGYQFVKTVHGSDGVDVRINEDDLDVHVTFYIRAGDYDLEDLLQNWWQNVFLFANRVAYYPSREADCCSED